MRTYYEAPEAEVINFTAYEMLAVIDAPVGPEPDLGVGSRGDY